MVDRTPPRIKKSLAAGVVLSASLLSLMNTNLNAIPNTNDHVERVKRREQSTECWNEVDWGIKKPMPTSEVGSRACVSYDARHTLKPPMNYCVFPPGVQIQATDLKSRSPMDGVKEDGRAHDPRYWLESKHVAYDCVGRNSTGKFPCGGTRKTCDRRFDVETVLIHRKDDHNPFFMMSLVVNVWMMGKQNVQLIMFDDAGPLLVDDLFRKLLTPSHPILYANQIRDTWCFDAPLWTVPWEYSGPLMMHLNDKQSCGESQMIQEFVTSVHALYPNVTRADNRTTVTFVGRKHYNKRTIGRVWTNEREMVDALSKERPDLNVRLVYYEDILFEEQMHIDRTTDIMVGMHGAGMVHALFLPDGSHVVEVFPKDKHRWGYRNIAQYRGFTYDDFREGKDGAHQSKTVGVKEWLAYWKDWVPMPIKENG